MGETHPEGIAGNRHPAAFPQVHIRLHVAEDIVADRHVAFADRSRIAAAAASQDADVRRIRGGMVVLDGTASDRDLTDPGGAICAVDQYICGGRTISRMVTLDVTAADMDISHIPAAADYTTASVVADVAADDVRLVQIHPVVVDAYPSILIDVATGK